MIKQQILRVANPLSIPVVVTSLRNFYRSDREITPLDQSARVLIFAPHIDDETIGAGGMLKRYAAYGTKVHVAVVTDGNKSNPGNVLSSDDLVLTRQRELMEIQQLLGISDITYLNYPDSQVSAKESSEDFVELIDRIRPDIVYTTSLIDAHPDHVYTAHLVADALRFSVHKPNLVREYEINCPVPPEFINCIMDISEEFPIKRKATEVFKSQAIAFDGFLTLAGIKSALVRDPAVKYVETFIENSPGRFIDSAMRLRVMDRDYWRYFKQANRTITLPWAIFKNIELKRKLYQSR